MKSEDKKRFKKLYDSKKVRITVSMNPYEVSLLESMMKEDDWENTGGFIKYKVFGLDYKKEYNKMIKKADQATLQKTIVNLMSDFNNHIDYSNARFHKELTELKKKSEMLDAKAVSKWVALVKSWNDIVERKTSSLLRDCQEILKRMDIIVERKQADYLRSLPDSVLEEYKRDWEDTNSPEFMEAVRRINEEPKKK